MKKLFYFLAFIFLPVCMLHAQTKTNDLASENLKGYVKSVTAIKFNAAEKFGDVTKGKKTKREYNEFNKSGFRIESSRKYYEDDSEWKVKLKYDDNNNPVEVEENDEGEVEISKRKFNDKGLVEEEDTFDKKGKLTGKTKFKNNSSGQMIQMVEYDATGKLTYTLENKYNESNQLISSLGYDETRKLLSSNYYKYDMRGNIIEDIDGNRNKKGSMEIVTNTYRFNSKKQKLEETYSPAGSKQKTTTFEYDTNGNLAVEKDSYNNQETYTYTYDKQNNWIRCSRSRQSFGTTTFEITEQEIKYYDEKDIPADVKNKIQTNGYSYFEDLDFDLNSGKEKAVTKLSKTDEAALKKAYDDRLDSTVRQNKLTGPPIPGYKVFTTDSTLVNLPDYMEKNRLFKDKPTLLVTWSNVWCGPCLKKIDTLLSSGLALKYNIVLINKEGVRSNFSKLKNEILNHTPNYNTNAILLFDRNNQLAPIDANSAPLFLWLDKKMKWIVSYAGYDISVKAIGDILLKVE